MDSSLRPPHNVQPWSSRSSVSEETLCDDDNMSEKMSPKMMADVESQPIFPPSKEPQSPSSMAMEYRVPARTKLLYLGGYFLLNLSLTLYNKALLGNFKFPWLLTALHAASASFGCFVLEGRGYFTVTQLGKRENLVLVAFSFLFTVNIAMSNVSLAMVSVPFHQIMRSTTPVFTILIYRICYSRSYSFSTYLSLIPLILGVLLTTYGDYFFTTMGLICTLAGTVLAATKTIVTNRLMTGSLALPALEILLRMSPLAALQSLAFAYFTGETEKFQSWVADGHLTPITMVALLGNGAIAFLLNISSFQTNKIAGALTITVCGNVKQCLTILLGIVLFNVQVGLLNGCGMVLALVGAAWYSKNELKKRTNASAPIPPPVRQNSTAIFSPLQEKLTSSWSHSPILPNRQPD